MSGVSGQTTAGTGQALIAVSTYGARPGFPSLRCELGAESDAAAAARRRIRECFAAYLSDDAVADAALVASELVANAGAVSRPSGTVGLITHVVGSDLLIEVFDQSLAVPHNQFRDPEDLSEDGRGLLLVEALSRAWGWHSVAGGKVVWSLLSLSPYGVGGPDS